GAGGGGPAVGRLPGQGGGGLAHQPRGGGAGAGDRPVSETGKGAGGGGGAAGSGRAGGYQDRADDAVPRSRLSGNADRGVRAEVADYGARADQARPVLLARGRNAGLRLGASGRLVHEPGAAPVSRQAAGDVPVACA